MTIRLTVDEAAWRHHVRSVADAVDDLVPVVKGNGYGFGRTWLAETARELADIVAVGTVHELVGLPAEVEVNVLTPTLDPGPVDDPDRTILTVGSTAHVDALAAHGRAWRVVVKLESSMRRYGGGPDLLGHALDAGLRVEGVAVHPPLVGDDRDHVSEIVARLAGIPTELPAWVSHLGPEALASLPPERHHRLRLGTALWHGDKSMLHLGADVLDSRPVTAGERVGYRAVEVPVTGSLVMIGAGTANGVAPLPDGRSPFHHAKRRLALVEPPHMHTSMAVVPAGDPCPAVGELVDLQRPLTATSVDQVVWR